MDKTALNKYKRTHGHKYRNFARVPFVMHFLGIYLIHKNCITYSQKHHIIVDVIKLRYSSTSNK